MTFTDFQSFANWCIDIQEIKVESYDGKEGRIIIRDLWDTPGMIVCELLVSAYDSEYEFGAMNSDMDNGSIIIYE